MKYILEHGYNIVKTSGNPSSRHTYEWKGIALSDDLDALIELAHIPFRIIDKTDGSIIKINKTGLCT